eukprot:COSAG02_NODE_565_length_20246_cov_13.930163_6_plen_162_part_00
MVLLALELTGNATSDPSYTFTLRHPVTYSKATLVGIDLHAPSPLLSESWSNTQTGDDYPQNRTAYAPLYADIEGIADNGHVMFHTSHSDADEHRGRLVPIGVTNQIPCIRKMHTCMPGLAVQNYATYPSMPGALRALCPVTRGVTQGIRPYALCHRSSGFF